MYYFVKFYRKLNSLEDMKPLIYRHFRKVGAYEAKPWFDEQKPYKTTVRDKVTIQTKVQ